MDIRHSLDECFEYFLFSHPLEHLLERTLGRKCTFHHGYMKEGGFSETRVHLYHDHGQENPTIYQSHLYYRMERDWYETYIHLYHHHQDFINNCESESGWSIET